METCQNESENINFLSARLELLNQASQIEVVELPIIETIVITEVDND